MTRCKYGTHDGVSLSGAEPDVLADEYQSTVDALEEAGPETVEWDEVQTHFGRVVREIEKRYEQGARGLDLLPAMAQIIDDYDEVAH